MTESIRSNKVAISKADVYSVNDSNGILFVSLIMFYFYEASELSIGVIRREKRLYHRLLKTHYSYSEQLGYL